MTIEMVSIFRIFLHDDTVISYCDRSNFSKFKTWRTTIVIPCIIFECVRCAWDSTTNVFKNFLLKIVNFDVRKTVIHDIWQCIFQTENVDCYGVRTSEQASLSIVVVLIARQGMRFGQTGQTAISARPSVRPAGRSRSIRASTHDRRTVALIDRVGVADRRRRYRIMLCLDWMESVEQNWYSKSRPDAARYALASVAKLRRPHHRCWPPLGIVNVNTNL